MRHSVVISDKGDTNPWVIHNKLPTDFCLGFAGYWHKLIAEAEHVMRIAGGLDLHQALEGAGREGFSHASTCIIAPHEVQVGAAA